MREIIRDEEVTENLSQKGVSVVNAFDPKLIDELRSTFNRLHPNWNDLMKTGYYVSMLGDSPEYYASVHNEFHNMLKEHLDGVFSNYKVPVIVAQVKGVGNQSRVVPHQDLTVVDESKYKSYVFWIPLEDSTEDNGALWFLESSHKVFRDYRIHTAHYLFDEPEEYILSHAKRYPIKTGQALLFDPATLHFSQPNVSEKPRISLGVEVVDADAELKILHDDPSSENGTLDVYEVPENFWLYYKNFVAERLEAPSFGTRIGHVQGFRTEPYSRQEFVERYEAALV